MALQQDSAQITSQHHAPETASTTGKNVLDQQIKSTCRFPYRYSDHKTDATRAALKIAPPRERSSVALEIGPKAHVVGLQKSPHCLGNWPEKNHEKSIRKKQKPSRNLPLRRFPEIMCAVARSAGNASMFHIDKQQKLSAHKRTSRDTCAQASSSVFSPPSKVCK